MKMCSNQLFRITTLLVAMKLKSIMADKVCVPSNWTHFWTRVGNAWFTRTVNLKGTWDEMTAFCEGIEAGKTSIANIKTEDEMQRVVSTMDPCLDRFWWLGGVRVGVQTWYWFNKGGTQPAIERIESATFWKKGRPVDYSKRVDCMCLDRIGGKGEWYDDLCTRQFGAICELRC